MGKLDIVRSQRQAAINGITKANGVVNDSDERAAARQAGAHE